MRKGLMSGLDIGGLEVLGKVNGEAGLVETLGKLETV